MNNWLSLCIMFQSTFFFVFLLVRKNKEHRGIMAFCGLNFLVFGLYFLAGIKVIDFVPSSTLTITFDFLGCLIPISIFYLIHSLTQKPINKWMKLFWLLPFLNIANDLVLKYFLPDILKPNYYYENWYVCLVTYYKPLLFIALLIEMQDLKRYSQKINFNNRHLKFLFFLWARWFLIFQAIRVFTAIVYLFLTLANGRLFTIKNEYLIYSENNYDTIQLGLLVYFLSIFGYLVIKNTKVSKEKNFL